MCAGGAWRWGRGQCVADGAQSWPGSWARWPCRTWRRCPRRASRRWPSARPSPCSCPPPHTYDWASLTHIHTHIHTHTRAHAGSTPVATECTRQILRLKPPPARRFIEKGVPVALGSDFNPNAHCLSMPSVMHFACVLLRMTMPEALAAATINAAGATSLLHAHRTLALAHSHHALHARATLARTHQCRRARPQRHVRQPGGGQAGRLCAHRVAALGTRHVRLPLRPSWHPCGAH